MSSVGSIAAVAPPAPGAQSDDDQAVEDGIQGFALSLAQDLDGQITKDHEKMEQRRKDAEQPYGP